MQFACLNSHNIDHKALKAGLKHSSVCGGCTRVRNSLD